MDRVEVARWKGDSVSPGLAFPKRFANFGNESENIQLLGSREGGPGGGGGSGGGGEYGEGRSEGRPSGGRPPSRPASPPPRKPADPDLDVPEDDIPF